MNRLQRPAKGRDKWESRPAVIKAMTDIKDKADKREPLTEKDFPACWSGPTGIKELFAASQYRLCGYCAHRIDTNTGAMDHFRPKAAVTRTVSTKGEEVNELTETDGLTEEVVLTNVRGRTFRPDPGADPGYWWLAYDWNNYVFSCERCNTGWKRTLFPANSGGIRIEDAAEHGRIEQPLLLNPFEVNDPLKHFKFDTQGAIAGVTAEGSETIETCGLDRGTLTTARREKFRSALLLLGELNQEGLPAHRRKELVREMVDLGQWSMPFATTWRSILGASGFEWTALDAEARKSAP